MAGDGSTELVSLYMLPLKEGGKEIVRDEGGREGGQRDEGRRREGGI